MAVLSTQLECGRQIHHFTNIHWRSTMQFSAQNYIILYTGVGILRPLLTRKYPIVNFLRDYYQLQIYRCSTIKNWNWANRSSHFNYTNLLKAMVTTGDRIITV